MFPIVEASSDASPTALAPPAQLGDRVIYHYPDGLGPNGSSASAAIVTRVWTRDLVNLTLFPDLQPIAGIGSVSRAGSQHWQDGSGCWTPHP